MMNAKNFYIFIRMYGNVDSFEFTFDPPSFSGDIEVTEENLIKLQEFEDNVEFNVTGNITVGEKIKIYRDQNNNIEKGSYFNTQHAISVVVK